MACICEARREGAAEARRESGCVGCDVDVDVDVDWDCADRGERGTEFRSGGMVAVFLARERLEVAIVGRCLVPALCLPCAKFGRVRSVCWEGAFRLPWLDESHQLRQRRVYSRILKSRKCIDRANCTSDSS